MTLKRRLDVDAVVKSNHKKGSGSEGSDLWKKCDEKGHCARDCRRPREGAEKGTKAMMAREQEKAKILSRNSIANAGTVESTVTGLKLVGRHVQRHQKRRVKEVQER